MNRWLGEFLDQSRSSDTPVHATYVVSGEALPSPARSADSTPADNDEADAYGDSQASSSSSSVPSVPTWQMLLTPEEDLERVAISRLSISPLFTYDFLRTVMNRMQRALRTCCVCPCLQFVASDPQGADIEHSLCIHNLIYVTAPLESLVISHGNCSRTAKGFGSGSYERPRPRKTYWHNAQSQLE